MTTVTTTDVSGLTQLGSATATAQSPDEAVLERVPTENGAMGYVVRFTCPEFTSLCPMTGQPDFAHIVIDYVPDQWLVESKSLKLFLHSFRNHGAFHEDCTMEIAKRLAAGPRVAHRLLKDNLNRALKATFADCLDMESANLAQARMTEDHKEAAAAFAEKRAPRFKGR